MAKLFCFYMFGRKMKATKLKLEKEPVRQRSKDTFDPCGVAEKILEKSASDVDSPDSCSNRRPEVPGSKDACIEQNFYISDEMQETSSKTDGQMDAHMVRDELAGPERPAKSCESNSEFYSCSLQSPKIHVSEGASVGVNEATSRSDDESPGLHTATSCHDSNVEGADASEGSSGGLESASNPPSCEDLNRPPGESASLGYEIEALDRGTEYVYSPDAAISPPNKSDTTLLDDVVLTGHISDPGIYDRGEWQSMFKSTVLLSNNIVAAVDNKGTFLRKSESESRICELVDLEGNVEKMHLEVGEHSSSPVEPFFCAEKVILKPESTSKNSDPSEHNLWWKILMASNRNIHLEGSSQASDAVAFEREADGNPPDVVRGYNSDAFDMGHDSEHDDVSQDVFVKSARINLVKPALEGNEDGQEDALEIGGQSSFGMGQPSKEYTALPTAESGLSRVEQWILNNQHRDAPDDEEIASGNEKLSNEICMEEGGVVSGSVHKTFGHVNVETESANAFLRSLSPLSTVAHIAGIGLHEVPVLGMFNSLKTINLSSNKIARVPSGCLPRSLHMLDLSRNRISAIEGFRELSRLRVLNLSYNRISRIGHGLANCTLIKELYLVGNKIAEVEGLHRLLKLSILDLSFNKLTSSKALGQLAANYSSLFALNLLGNPVHTNVGDEQLRKLVASIAPSVTYLNKQPIKAVPAREAVVDSVARAALGISHRNIKSGSARALRKQDIRPTMHQQNKSHSRHGKDVERRRAPLPADSESLRPARLPIPHHRHRQHNKSHQVEKGAVKVHRHRSRSPMSVHEQFLQKLAMDMEPKGMHRSRSESALQD